MSAQIVRLTVAGECDNKACEMPMVTVEYDNGRTVTVHDDGSWDGHSAWQERGEA